ncbi:prepilin-type N-terminal cleavage/methylation domain-containing protein [uncultured Nocardioides sp.]|uniref:type IV pilin protein n=1 Tax=uncultured Nocardioides sp. TaxID=198441 RepID=UPI000C4568C0|nr:prepilin-type cleavage/methylation domain-containing protein [Nocardioides sp.]
MRFPQSKQDKGFTLIELLVVVVIIGILAAIAIPVFLNQRQKAVDASIKSDLKSAATNNESYFVDNQAYAASTADLPDFNSSPNNTIEFVAANATSDGYCIEGTNDDSSIAPDSYWYDSDLGGLVTGDPDGTGACPAP